MARYVVKYYRDGRLTNGGWATVIDGGFLSADCTKEEIEDFVYKKHCINNENTRYSSISIGEADNTNCFGGRFNNNLLNTMIKEVGNARERFRQKNC